MVETYSPMVKHSTPRFPFTVLVLYFDEMYKSVRVNATQVVNAPQPPPAFPVAVFGMHKTEANVSASVRDCRFSNP